jgi:hypothetical protein
MSAVDLSMTHLENSKWHLSAIANRFTKAPPQEPITVSIDGMPEFAIETDGHWIYTALMLAKSVVRLRKKLARAGYPHSNRQSLATIRTLTAIAQEKFPK